MYNWNENSHFAGNVGDSKALAEVVTRWARLGPSTKELLLVRALC